MSEGSDRSQAKDNGDTLNPFLSRIQYRLRHDAEAVERRAWYTGLQQGFYRSLYEEKAQAEEASSQISHAIDQPIIASHLDNQVDPIPTCPSLVQLHTASEQTKLTLLCFPDLFCNYTAFYALLPYLPLRSMDVHALALPGKMHRVKEAHMTSFPALLRTQYA
ncbi:hypothetical protein EON64_10365, partial [archaeon]